MSRGSPARPSAAIAPVLSSKLQTGERGSSRSTTRLYDFRRPLRECSVVKTASAPSFVQRRFLLTVPFSIPEVVDDYEDQAVGAKVNFLPVTYSCQFFRPHRHLLPKHHDRLRPLACTPSHQVTRNLHATWQPLRCHGPRVSSSLPMHDSGRAGVVVMVMMMTDEMSTSSRTMQEPLLRSHGRII